VWYWSGSSDSPTLQGRLDLGQPVIDFALLTGFEDVSANVGHRVGDSDIQLSTPHLIDGLGQEAYHIAS
jgi:hypothetical protein